MATLFRTDRTTEDVSDTSLENLQRLVGGYIEILYLEDGRVLIVDDEGKLKDKPVNRTATLLWMHHAIFGDVVLANADEMDEEEDVEEEEGGFQPALYSSG